MAPSRRLSPTTGAIPAGTFDRPSSTELRLDRREEVSVYGSSPALVPRGFFNTTRFILVFSSGQHRRRDRSGHDIGYRATVAANSICVEVPILTKRDCRAWPRTSRSRPDLYVAAFHDLGTGAKELYYSAATIKRVTGVPRVGFNAFWLRGTPRTLQSRHELGYTYYIDDASRDEPFLVNVRNKLFAVAPTRST